MKKGLIFEGGGMRAIFSCGITDVMMENKIQYDGIIGVSSGATFGISYKSKQIGRNLRYILKYINDPRFVGLQSLFKTGDFINGEFCYHTITKELDPIDLDAYKNNPTEYYVVCVDVHTGKPVYKKLDQIDYDAMEWVRASTSLPLISKFVNVEGYSLLDGGMVDPLPIKYFESLGFNKNVAILTRPRNYRKVEHALFPLLRIILRKYPNLVDAIEKRYIVYNESLKYIAKKEKAGDLFVLRPEKPLEISRGSRNITKLQEAYDLGRKMAEEKLEELKNYLK